MAQSNFVNLCIQSSQTGVCGAPLYRSFCTNCVQVHCFLYSQTITVGCPLLFLCTCHRAVLGRRARRESQGRIAPRYTALDLPHQWNRSMPLVTYSRISTWIYLHTSWISLYTTWILHEYCCILHGFSWILHGYPGIAGCCRRKRCSWWSRWPWETGKWWGYLSSSCVAFGEHNPCDAHLAVNDCVVVCMCTSAHVCLCLMCVCITYLNKCWHLSQHIWQALTFVTTCMHIHHMHRVKQAIVVTEVKLGQQVSR